MRIYSGCDNGQILLSGYVLLAKVPLTNDEHVNQRTYKCFHNLVSFNVPLATYFTYTYIIKTTLVVLASQRCTPGSFYYINKVSPYFLKSFPVSHSLSRIISTIQNLFNLNRISIVNKWHVHINISICQFLQSSIYFSFTKSTLISPSKLRYVLFSFCFAFFIENNLQ